MPSRCGEAGAEARRRRTAGSTAAPSTRARTLGRGTSRASETARARWPLGALAVVVWDVRWQRRQSQDLIATMDRRQINALAHRGGAAVVARARVQGRTRRLFAVALGRAARPPVHLQHRRRLHVDDR